MIRIPSIFSTRIPLLLVVAALFAGLPLQARLVIADDALPNAVKNVTYSYTLLGKGGTSPWTWMVVGGSLPSGMAMSTSGVVFGSPTSTGNYEFTVRFTDSAPTGPVYAQKKLSLEVVSADASPRWCGRGGFGGDITSIAASTTFAADNFAYAGTTGGGVLSTADGGNTWAEVAAFGQTRIADLAISPCTGSKTVWAITQSRQIAATYYSVPDAVAQVYRYDGATLTLEASFPSFAGTRRRIRAASCNGIILASDDKGGAAWRDPASGNWTLINQGFPLFSGAYPILDTTIGLLGAAPIGVALDAINQSVWLRTDFSTNGRWSECHFLPNGPTRYSIGLTPDGKVLIGDLAGNVAVYDMGWCSSAPLNLDLYDGATLATPQINGFTVSPCYNAASGVKPVYIATQQGLFYTADYDAAGATFSKTGLGLQSEAVADIGVSNLCTDPRLLIATRGRGIAYGDAALLCHAPETAKLGADLIAIAGSSDFSSPTANACSNGTGPVGLHAASSASGILRTSRDGREFSAAGDSREQKITDVTATLFGSSDFLYAAAESGVYRSINDGLSWALHYATDEPLLELAGIPESGNGAAYGIGLGGVYYSNATPAWGKVADFAAFNFTEDPEDLAPGASLSATLTDHELWIAMGPDGVAEYQRIGTGAPILITHRGGLTGYDVRRITAQRRAGLSNSIVVQAQSLSGAGYRLLRGTKTTTPGAAVSFSLLSATGLPTSEEANQILIEPSLSGTYIWVLLPTLGLYRSTNTGSTFAKVTGGGLPGYYNAMQLVPAVNFYSALGRLDVALLLAGKGVYYSSDGGNNYCFGPTPVGQMSGRLKALSVSTLNDYSLVAGTQEGVFASGDRGVRWRLRNDFATDGRPFNAVLHVQLNATTERIVAGTNNGIYTATGAMTVWTNRYSGANITSLLRDAAGALIATRDAGASLRSIDNGLSWSVVSGPADGAAADYNGAISFKGDGKAESVEAATAGYWMAGALSGASYSNDGISWTAAPGVNDYALPAAGNYQAIKSLGGTPSKVLIGHSTLGLYRTLDGGDTWRKVSGSGSGLEATSQNASALLTATTAFATTDLLVGMNGASTGGVYLSGDSGAHWTQVNQGYDPATLSITSLVKTSCSGCPVQYYSGSYGSGVYTRTITVNAPPTFPSASAACFGSTGCACVDTAGSGPVSGGQAFKICGANFQVGAVVEFDGLPATGCTRPNSSTLTCTGTPPHLAGAVTIRIRNPDTRDGLAPNAYNYTGGTPRTIDLLVAKSGGDANLTWTCGACGSLPASVFRGQDALFTLYPENYNGGTGGSYTNMGAVSTGYSYFWSVE